MSRHGIRVVNTTFRRVVCSSKLNNVDTDANILSAGLLASRAASAILIINKFKSNITPLSQAPWLRARRQLSKEKTARRNSSTRTSGNAFSLPPPPLFSLAYDFLLLKPTLKIPPLYAKASKRELSKAFKYYYAVGFLLGSVKRPYVQLSSPDRHKG